MAVVGTAYVKVQAISTGLADEIKRQVKAAVREASKDIDKDMEEAGRSGGKAYGKGFKEEVTKGVKEGMKDVLDEVDKHDGEAENAGDRVGNRVSEGFSKSVKRGIGSKMSTAMKIAGKAVKFGALFELLPAAAAVAFGGVGAAATGLTAAITGLGAAAAGAGVAMVAGLAPLAQGMILMKWAMDANADAAKALTENWKGFKNEIGKAVGAKMFDHLTIAVDTLKEKFVGNEGIMSAFKETGDVLGLVTRNIVDTATKDMGRFERVILNNNNALMGIGEGAAGLAESFIILLDAMGPITREIGDMAARFGTWVRDTLAAKAASGELQATLMTLWNALKQVGRIVKDFGTGLFEIFRLAAPQAKDMGNSIEDIAKRFKEWTQSEAGQAKITKFFEDSTRIAKELGKLIKDIFTGWSDGTSGFNADAIISVMETMRTTWLPAIKDIVKQIKDALDIQGSGDFFKNIGQSLQNIADSGVVGRVVQTLDDIVTKLGEISSSPAGTTILGIGAALSSIPGSAGLAFGALKKIFGGAGAGGGGGGGAGGGGFLAGAKGLLKGGIVTFIAGEILSASSENFAGMWDGLWGSVFSGAGTALTGTLGLIGDALAPVGRTIEAGIRGFFGDAAGARTAIREAGDAWDDFTVAVTEIDTWFSSRRTKAEKIDMQEALFGRFDTLTFTQSLDELAKIMSEKADALGMGGDKLRDHWSNISKVFDKMPIDDGLKAKFTEAFGGVTQAIASGDQDISQEMDLVNQTLDEMELAHPEFKTAIEGIRTEMGLVSNTIGAEGDRYEAAWTAMFASAHAVVADADLSEPLRDIGTRMIVDLGHLQTNIETNGPDVGIALEQVLTDLSQIPADVAPDSSLGVMRKNITDSLVNMGEDIVARGGEVPPELRSVLDKISVEAEQGMQGIPAAIQRGMIDAGSNIQAATAVLENHLRTIPEGERAATVAAAEAAGLIGPEVAAALKGGFEGIDFSGVAQTHSQEAVAALRAMPAEFRGALTAGMSDADLAGALAPYFASLPTPVRDAAIDAAKEAGIFGPGVAEALDAGLAGLPQKVAGALAPIVPAFGSVFDQVNAMPGLSPMEANVAAGIQGVVAAVSTGQQDITAQVQNLAKAFEGADVSFEPMRNSLVTSLAAAGVDVASIAPTLLTPLTALPPEANAAGQATGQGVTDGLASGLRGTGAAISTELQPVPGLVTSALSPAEQAATAALLGVPPAAGAAVDPTAAIVASGLAGTPGAVSQALAPAGEAAGGAMRVVPTEAGTAVAGTPAAVQAGLAGVPGAVSTALAPVPGAVGTAMDPAKARMQQDLANMKASPGPGLAGVQGNVSAALAVVGPAVTTVMNQAMQAMLTVLNLMRMLPAAALGGIAAVVSGAMSGIVGAVTGVMISTLNAMSSYMSQMVSKMSGFVSEMRRQKQEIDNILTAALENKAKAEQAGREAKAAIATAQADKATADAASAAAAAARAAAAAAVPPFIPPQGWTMRHVVSAADFGALQGGWQQAPYGRGLSGTTRIVLPEPVIKATVVPAGGGSEMVNVQVYIGQSELEEIIDKRVSYGDAQLDRKIRYGRRGVSQ